MVLGGFGTRALLDDEETLAWIRTVAADASQTTSVCTGSPPLAKAGLREGWRATTHWGALDLLASLDADIIMDRNSRYVDDGIITSAGVSAGIEMAFYVVERNCEREVADETAQYFDYPRPDNE